VILPQGVSLAIWRGRCSVKLFGPSPSCVARLWRRVLRDDKQCSPPAHPALQCHHAIGSCIGFIGQTLEGVEGWIGRSADGRTRNHTHLPFSLAAHRPRNPLIASLVDATRLTQWRGSWRENEASKSAEADDHHASVPRNPAECTAPIPSPDDSKKKKYSCKVGHSTG